MKNLEFGKVVVVGQDNSKYLALLTTVYLRTMALSPTPSCTESLRLCLTESDRPERLWETVNLVEEEGWALGGGG